MANSGVPTPSNASEGLYANITLTDVLLATAYYPILIDLAKHKHCLTYGELVQRAKEENPSNTTVKSAIPVSTGRRLDVVRLFTRERGIPDLSALVINKNKGECGKFYTDHFDPVAIREEIFAFDWTAVSTDFAGFVKLTEKAITPRKKIKEPAALALLHSYYQEHKATLPADIRTRRELIIELLMEGFSPEEAFTQVLPMAA